MHIKIENCERQFLFILLLLLYTNIFIVSLTPSFLLALYVLSLLAHLPV